MTYSSRFSFLFFITLTSALNMATSCGSCPEDENVFVDTFDDCGGSPCGWSADTGLLTGAGTLVVPAGTTARREVSAELGRSEFSAVDYRVRCETGATVQFEASGPQPVILDVGDPRGDGTVTVVARNADRGLFLIEELAFTSMGGACTIESLRVYSASYCD